MGTPIHLHLKCDDDNGAIDPTSLRIILINTIRIPEDINSNPRKHANHPPYTVIRTCVANAACYRHYGGDENVGVVHGEIKLPKNLTPDFEFKGVRSEYEVIFIPSFIPPSATKTGMILEPSVYTHVLRSISVKVFTTLPDSQIEPISFLPPHLLVRVEAEAALSPTTGPTVQHRPSLHHPSAPFTSQELANRDGNGGSASSSKDATQQNVLDPFERLVTLNAGSGWSRSF